MLTPSSLHNSVKTTLRQFFVFLLCVLALASPSQFLFALTLDTIQFEMLSSADQETHIAYSGDIDKPGVLFIHGTPGSWSAFRNYLNNSALQQEHFMVSYDRPQWGLSKILSEQNPNLFATQVDSIKLILKRFPNKKWVIIGHSLGASIAPKVALTAPDSISGLLLLAGSLDPKLGNPRWYNHVANNILIKWLVPQRLRASNKEIMVLRSELSSIETELMATTLEARLTVIQGMQDKLVSPNNTRYVDENWRNIFKEVSIIELAEEGHFLPWRQQGLIIEELKKLTKNNQ